MSIEIRTTATPFQTGDAAIVNRGGNPAAVTLGDAATKATGTTAGTVAAGDHTHSAGQITGLGDSATRNVGTTAGTVATGDHSHTASEIGDLATVALTGSANDLLDLTLGTAAALDTGTGVGQVVIGGDARLTDAREWTATTVSQIEAETGTATTARKWTAERVFQAIAAFFNADPGTAMDTKAAPVATDEIIGVDVVGGGNAVRFPESWFAPRTIPINAQVGTTYEIVLTDAGKVIEMNNAAANTLTIPVNATAAFPVGTIINVIQVGAGATTIDAAIGVTLNGVSGGNAALSARWSQVALLKRGTDEWVIGGAHGAVA